MSDKNFFNGEWVRKATPPELSLLEYNQDCVLTIWYQMGLCSLKPIQEEHVRTTVNHFYRKVANVGLCFGTRDGETWLKRATNPNVDFEVLEGLSLEEVRDSLRGHRYNAETGPLFCVRMVRNSSDGDEAAQIEIEKDSAFTYKCHMFLGLNHAITDGTSNQMLVGFFVTLLNDVIGGKPVNDEEPMGTFMPDDQTVEKIMQKKLLLESDPKLKKKIGSELQFQKEHAPPLASEFPAFEKKQRTRALVRFLDQSTTVKFIQRCRQEKVTVSSAFSAMVNVAIVDILAKHGSNLDSYTIIEFHTVNMRRYWDSKPPKPLGLHMSYPLLVFAETPRDVHNRFWEYARDLGERRKEDVLSGRLLCDLAYAMIADTPKPKVTPGVGNYFECDYLTSNMGDVTPSVTEGGDHVRIKTLVRGSVYHTTGYPVLLSSHTLRGIFTFIFEYSGTAIQDEIAEKVCSQTVKNIHEFIS